MWNSKGQSDKRPCGTARDRATRGDVTAGDRATRGDVTAGDRATMGHVEQQGTERQEVMSQQGTERQEAMWNSRGQSDKRPRGTAAEMSFHEENPSPESSDVNVIA